jgi:hypothetical protein
MIGPDNRGRFWTIAIWERQAKWYVATGWPSAPDEIDQYYDEGN